MCTTQKHFLIIHFNIYVFFVVAVCIDHSTVWMYNAYTHILLLLQTPLEDPPLPLPPRALGIRAGGRPVGFGGGGKQQQQQQRHCRCCCCCCCCCVPAAAAAGGRPPQHPVAAAAVPLRLRPPAVSVHHLAVVLCAHQ